MRLLLDEQMDRALAEQLRKRGYDVIAVTEDPALRGLSDAALLEWATAQDRAIATYDLGDFLPLLEERISAGEPVAGLILISATGYPSGERGYGRLLRALIATLEKHRSRKALAGRAVWL